jgi:O-antigen ligase
MRLKDITVFPKKIYARFESQLFILFLLSLFLVKLSPFYFFPSSSRIASSHTLAKIVILAIFGIIFLAKSARFASFSRKNKILFNLLTLFFISQSISVLVTTDVTFFWKSYHNLIVALTIFFLSFFFAAEKQKIQSINKFVLISGIILVSYELSLVLFPEKTLFFLKKVIQKEVLDAYLTNISRARYSLDMNIELFLPFFLVWITLSSQKKFLPLRFVLFIFSAGLMFISFLSNFRSRVLMNLFGAFGFLGLYFLKEKRFKRSVNLKKIVVVLFFLAISVYTALVTSNKLFYFNVFDRFLLQDRREDIETVNFRLKAGERSLDMFASSPFLGIGLGNYQVFVKKTNLAMQRYFYLDKYKEEYSKRVYSSPHNVIFQIIGETGSLGLVAFLALVIYFAAKDIRFLLSRKLNLTDGYILSFWVIVIFMLFNPASTIFMIGWFWFFRGIIEASYFSFFEPKIL